VKDRLFLMNDHNGFPLVMTQPEGVNGADLLPLSLIGCSAWDLMDILQKQRQPVSELRVFADSLREDRAPWRFKAIHVTYQISGRGLNAEKIRHAVELTETKYCSVFVTLSEAVTLSSDFKLIDK
jgi:putative redox protein